MKNFWLWRAEEVQAPVGYDGTYIEYSPIHRKLLEKLKDYWQQHYAHGRIPLTVLRHAIEAIERVEN